MRRLVAPGFTALLAVALLGACGGSSGARAGSTLPPANTTTGTRAPGTPPTGIGAPTDTFSKLFGRAGTQRFKITFVSDSGATETYAQDGTGRSSYRSGTTRTFTSSAGTIQCFARSGSRPQCVKVGRVQAGASTFLGLYNLGRSYATALGGRYGRKSSKRIAGRTATCVTFTARDFPSVPGVRATALAGSLTLCIDHKTGVLLEWAHRRQGITTEQLLVTKFAKPSGSDFTPPTPPQTIPGGG